MQLRTAVPKNQITIINDRIQLIFSGIDEAMVLFFIRVRSMGEKEGFKGHGSILLG
jgi:hypothetical protein